MGCHLPNHTRLGGTDLRAVMNSSVVVFLFFQMAAHRCGRAAWGLSALQASCQTACVMDEKQKIGCGNGALPLRKDSEQVVDSGSTCPIKQNGGNWGPHCGPPGNS